MNSESGPPLAFAVVILGAGQSRRMGSPKLLLPWNDTTVVGHLVRTWTGLRASQIGIVVAPDAAGLNRELDRIGLTPENRMVNPDPDRGMFSSVQCAAAWEGWVPGLTHWILTLGDQPHVDAKTLKALVEFAARNPDRICQPMRNGRRRHPVVFPRRFFFQLATSTSRDLKEFLGAHSASLAGFESDDAGLDLDLDTPEDYERARPR